MYKQRKVLNVAPKGVRHDAETELADIWAQSNTGDTLTQSATFKARHGHLYPEVVRKLAKEENKTLTFYEFPQTMHHYIKTTKAIESLLCIVHQGSIRSKFFRPR